jgi:hypothetical protein
MFKLTLNYPSLHIMITNGNGWRLTDDITCVNLPISSTRARPMTLTTIVMPNKQWVFSTLVLSQDIDKMKTATLLPVIPHPVTNSRLHDEWLLAPSFCQSARYRVQLSAHTMEHILAAHGNTSNNRTFLSCLKCYFSSLVFLSLE